jgi:hypothetical protein
LRVSHLLRSSRLITIRYQLVPLLIWVLTRNCPLFQFILMCCCRSHWEPWTSICLSAAWTLSSFWRIPRGRCLPQIKESIRS